MRYQGRVYRPPSEADALIVQATLGCSWNHCVYCDMYRDKAFAPRPLDEALEDLALGARAYGPRISKLFIGDGDALCLPTASWEAILREAAARFPQLKRVSCYATAQNLLEKRPDELRALRALGLRRLYIGPESGDDLTLKKIAKGASFEDHVVAARRAHEAGMELSVIGLLGVGGVARSQAHAEATAALVTEMDPAFFSLLTTSIVPGTPLATLAETGRFTLPSEAQMLGEMKTILSLAQPTRALFRSNHASNGLPLGGTLPQDREAICALIDQALAGEIPLRPPWTRAL